MHGSNQRGYAAGKCLCNRGKATPTAPSLEGGNYQIGSLSELLWFAALINGDTSAETGTNGVAQNSKASAVLTADITISNDALSEFGLSTWKPIGYDDTHVFGGNFDGQKHVITFDMNEANEYKYYGLFGTTGEKNYVQYFTLKGDITMTKGANYVGAVAGSQKNTRLFGVYSHVNIKNPKAGSYTGGLVGTSIIRYDYQLAQSGSNGNIEGTAYVGGLGGNLDGIVGGIDVEFSMFAGTLKSTTNGAIGAIGANINATTIATVSYNEAYKAYNSKGEGCAEPDATATSMEDFKSGKVAYDYILSNWVQNVDCGEIDACPVPGLATNSFKVSSYTDENGKECYTNKIWNSIEKVKTSSNFIQKWDGTEKSLSTKNGVDFTWKGDGGARIEYYIEYSSDEEYCIKTNTSDEYGKASFEGGPPSKIGYYKAVITTETNGIYREDSADFAFEITKADVKEMSLGVSSISNPREPSDNIAKWRGDYVYFGTYNNNPIKFRVLNKAETSYGSSTMFLDCDAVLDAMTYGANDSTWETSNVKAWMNGSSEGQLLNQFTGLEQNVIASSTKTKNELDVSGLNGTGYYKWVPITNTKVFALSPYDLLNNDYGYYYFNFRGVGARTKSGGQEYYFIRNGENEAGMCTGIGQGDDAHYSGVGDFSMLEKNDSQGVSPAMNIDLSKVLLSSNKSVDKTEALSKIDMSGESSEVWNLTLLDTSKTIVKTNGQYVTKVGSEITVPYTYTGSNVSQISVMITDKDYSNTDANILYYGKLNTTLENTGTGSFQLPENLPSGYKMYLIAEDVKGSEYTDYASKPLEIVSTDYKAPITPPSTPQVEKNKIYTSGSEKYKVTNANTNGTGTVTLASTTKNKAKMSSYSVPATVKISGKTFQVTAISDRMFKNCKKLKKVTIGSNVKTIGKEAFLGCKNLKTITIKSKKLTKVNKNAIKNVYKKAKIKVPSSKVKAYKKLFKKSTGFKKTMKITK